MVYFSLILPVYNVEQYLDRCIKSIIHQSFEDYEIILVDDGSTDTSGELCDLWEKKSDKITVVHKSNGGLASARNYGMKYASGDYIMFVDSDDWLKEGALKNCYEELEGGNYDVLKYGFQRVVDGVYGEEIVSSFQEGIYDRDKIERIILPQIVGPFQLFNYDINPLKSAWSGIYRRQFLQENNICFESERIILNEDYLYTLSVMLAAKNVKIIHKVYYYYDFRDGSISKRYIKNMLARKLELHKAYERELNKYALFSRYEKEYYSSCVDGFYACFTNECGKWQSHSKVALQNVRSILNIAECQKALIKCKHNNLSFKGLSIYLLMRFKLAALMMFLYRRR